MMLDDPLLTVGLRPMSTLIEIFVMIVDGYEGDRPLSEGKIAMVE